MKYKEKSNLRTGSLIIDILERVPVILCTFTKTFVGDFINWFAMKKTQKN